MRLKQYDELLAAKTGRWSDNGDFGLTSIVGAFSISG